MEHGLYEKIVGDISNEELRKSKYKKTRTIDDSEISRVLSITCQKLINDILSRISIHSERWEFIGKLNKTIGLEGFDYSDKKHKELLSVHDNKESLDLLNQYRPKTSISTSTLFIGNSGPTLESELSREIRTSDGIDFLISFIKFSGLRLIYDDLVEFTKHNKLRVITTSYMGASDYKAILELAKLPNTEVKISYDTKIERDFMQRLIISREKLVLAQLI